MLSTSDTLRSNESKDGPEKGEEEEDESEEGNEKKGILEFQDLCDYIF